MMRFRFLKRGVMSRMWSKTNYRIRLAFKK